MARVGPVIMAVVGDSFIEPCTVRAVVWHGVTTAGDTVVIEERSSGNVTHEFRATGAQTWQGLGLKISCPGGFRLAHISAGRVLVYLAEP